MNILSVTLFDAIGTGVVARLEPLSVSWLDELDGDGSFNLSVSYETGDSIGIGSVIKFAFGESSTAYVFAGVVDNLQIDKTGDGSAGAAKTYQVSGKGVRSMLADAVVFNSGANNVRSFTSQTSGYIFKTLFDEAQARGALSALTLGFSNTLDSNGDAFSETLTIDTQVGSTLGDVASEHGELAVDVYVGPDLEVQYYNSRGEDLSSGVNPIVLRVGANVSQLTYSSAGPVKNAVLIAAGEQGETYTTSTDSGSIASYGRKETFISLANTDDAAQITLAKTKLFAGIATPAESVTIETDLEGALPYLDYDVGDTVMLADDEGTQVQYRVRGITVNQDDAGNLSIIPELGSVRMDLDKRLQRLLNRAERGKAEGLTSAAVVIGVTPPDLGIGGVADFNFGEIVTYDELTGEGTVDIDGDTVAFTNGSGFNLAAGDEILTSTATNDTNYAVGFVTGAVYSNHTLTNYIIPSGVAGTPRTPPTEMTGLGSGTEYMINGPDWVAYMINSTQLLKVNMDGTSNVLSLSLAGTNIYTDGVTAAATNRTTTIQHLDGLGVTTTVSYSGTLTRINAAGYDGTDYCFVGTSTTVTKVIRVNGTTGAHTVTDISATFAAHTSQNVVTRAGSGYFCIWTETPGTGMWVNGTIYASIGTATGINGTYGRYHATGGGSGTNRALSQLDIEGGYLYWSYYSTGYYKMDLSTGGLTLYNNIYPTNPGFDPHIGVIGAGVVVLGGSISKSGGGYRPAFWLSDGSTATEILTTGTESTDAAVHHAIASGNGSVGYVYYLLASLQDYIVGATV